MTDPALGRLIVVGTGIRTTGQLTIEAIAWMKAADVVLHMVSDPIALALVRTWQPTTNIDLHRFYEIGVSRRRAYEEMADAIVDEVVAGRTACAAFYGHPGVFARAPHLAIARVRALGASAEMLPAISAQDCLFADLGVDPGDGCLSFEATNFVQFDHAADPTAHLVLWQIGVVGDWTHRPDRDQSDNVQVVVDKLAQWYPLDHEVTVYQAATRLDDPPRTTRVPLRSLPEVALGQGSTLHVPPSSGYRLDPRYAERLRRTM